MMNIVRYENVIFYKGRFYVNKEQIEQSFLDNRLKNGYEFTPSDIGLINIPDEKLTFDKGILLLHGFHWNPAHLLWDHVYPSWYGLFYKNNNCANEDFQWITIRDLNDIHVYTHGKFLEKFSGSRLDSLKSFAGKYTKPLKIPWLITGLENIGISNIDKKTLLVKTGLDVNNIDPIEAFVNRIYFRYNIKRNTLINNLNLDVCNNVIYIKNKRTYCGIENLFELLNNKYKNKYNFKIIDYTKFDFEQQLHILNTTCLCIVGVGSARFNTPFLPNGAIEIQTFQQDISRKNHIEYLDYHGGTLSKYVKIKNIPYYTPEEAMTYKYSNFLEEYIEEELKNLPCEIPVNLENNIPPEIKNIKYHPDYEKFFDIWRNNNSNIIEDFFDLLKINKLLILYDLTLWH